jgi:hypothetical protein
MHPAKPGDIDRLKQAVVDLVMAAPRPLLVRRGLSVVRS